MKGSLENKRDAKIKNDFVSSITFEFPKADVADINATWPDTILPKLIKMFANVIGKHLCSIINMDIEN